MKIHNATEKEITIYSGIKEEPEARQIINLEPGESKEIEVHQELVSK